MKSTPVFQQPVAAARRARRELTSGGSSPLGATVIAGGVNFSVFSKHATGIDLLLFDRDDDAPAGAGHSDRSGDEPQYHYWHVFVPGLERGTDLRIPRVRARSTPRTVIGSIRTRCCSIRTDAASSCRRATTARRPLRDGRQRRDGDEERRGRSVRLRLGRRSPSPTRHRRGPSSTRCTCAASRGTRARACPTDTRGTYAGLIEKIPYLQQLGVTAVELLPVFQFDAQDVPPGRTRQLLGLSAGVVLRAAPGVQLAAGSARAGRRVPRHGEGAAPRRHRGDPRRRVQPHGGRRSAAVRRCASAGWTTAPTTSSRAIRRATRTTAAAATRSTRTIRSSAA